MMDHPIPLSYEENMGSRDTWLGRKLGAYYDAGATFGTDQVQNRFNNQGNIGAFSDFIGDLTTKVAAGIPQIAGAITSLPVGVANKLSGGSFFDAFQQNPLEKISKAISEFGSEAFPTFQQQGFDQMSFLQQLAYPGQYATSNVQNLAFMGQAIAGSALLGGLNLGGKVAQAISKGGEFTDALSGIVSPNMAKLAANVNDYAAQSAMVISESASEAMDSYKDMGDKLRWHQINTGDVSMTEKQIRDKQDNAAFNVFWENMLTLAVTELPLVKLLSPLRGGRWAKAAADDIAMKMAGEGDKLVVPKTLTGLQKFLFDKGYGTGEVVKEALKVGLSEGLQESLQYSIQKVNDSDHAQEALWSNLVSYGKDALMNAFDMSDQERQKNAGAGALMGLMSLGLMSMTKHGPYQEAARFRDSQKQAIDALNTSYTDFQKASVLSKTADQKGRVYTEQDANGQPTYWNETPERKEQIEPATYQQIVKQFSPDEKGNYEVKGVYQTDDAGNPIKDPAKVLKFAADAKAHTELDDLINTELSKAQQDQMKLKLYKLEKFSKLANTAFDAGAEDILRQKLTSIQGMSAEDRQKLGYDPETSPHEIADYLDHMGRMENLWNSIKNSTTIGSTNVKDQTINKARQAIIAAKGARALTMDRLIQDADKELAGLTNKLITEAQTPEEVGAIENRISKISDAYYKEHNIADLFGKKTTFKDEETQAARLASERRHLVDAREELAKTVQDLLHPQDGFNNYKKNFESNPFSLTTPYELHPSTNYKVQDSSTPDNYKSYESRKIRQLKFQEKVRHAKSAFNSDLLNSWDKYYDFNGVSPETATSLSDLVNNIIDSKSTMYPDEVNKLTQTVVDYTKNVQDQLDHIGGQLESTGVNLDYGGKEDESPLNEQEHALLDQYDHLLQTQAALGNLHTDLEGTLDKIMNAEAIESPEISQEALKTQAYDELFSGFRKILQGSGWTGDTIREDYDNVADVEYELKRLQDLHDKVSTPLATDSFYRQFENANDVAIDTLKDILQRVKGNLANRALADRKQDEFYAHGVLNLLSLPTTEGTLRDALIAKHGASAVAKLEELIKIDPVLASLAASEMISHLDEGIRNDTFNSKKDEVRNFLANLEFFKAEGTALFKIDPVKEFNSFIENPLRALRHVISKIVAQDRSLGATDEEVAPLENFLSNYDVVKLESAAPAYTGRLGKDNLQTIINAYKTLTGIKQINQNPEFSEVGFLENLLSSIHKEAASATVGAHAIPSPSSSQTRVIRELTRFLTAAHNKRNHLYDNVIAVKAPAGAGKSLIVLPLAMSSSHLEGTEILAAAPKDKAAANIKEAVNSNYPAQTVNDLIDNIKKGALPEGVKVIVIDEAGALSISQVYQLASALAEHNQKGNEVKMVMVYDPNQITVDNSATPAIDLNAYAEMPLSEANYYAGDEATKQEYQQGKHIYNPDGSYKGTLIANLPFIQNIDATTSLASTYRSDVSEIVDLQNAFKSQSDIKTVNTSTSAPITNTKGILGTYAEATNANMISTLAASIATNPTRSRIIIVGNQEKANAYIAELAKANIKSVEVEIASPEEAQGITRDEVYVDLTTKDRTVFSSIPTYNQYMYTSLSRASKFLYMANAPAAKQTVDTTITDRVSKVKEGFKSSYEEKLKALKDQIQSLKDILGDAPAEVAKESKESIDNPIDEEKVETTEQAAEAPAEDELNDTEGPADVVDDEAAIPIDVPINENGVHVLRQPQSQAFDDVSGLPKLVEGDDVILVKDSDITTGQQRIMVLSEIRNAEGKVVAYRKIGILEESEVAQITANLGIRNPLQRQGYNFIKDTTIDPSGRNVVKVAGGKLITDFEPAKIAKGSHDLIYVYGNHSTYDFTDNGTRSALLEKFFKTMFGANPEQQVGNYREVLENSADHVKVIVYRTDKEVGKDFGNQPDASKRPRANRPYLIIEGLETREGKTMNRQFIALRPTILQKGSPAAERTGVHHIYDFIETLSKFQKELDKASLPGKYKELELGKPVKIQTKNDTQIYFPYHAFIIALSDEYQRQALGQESHSTISLAPDNPYLNLMFPDIPLENVSKELLQYAYQLDTLTHGNDLDELEGGGYVSEQKKKRRNYKGPAQLAMDAIASQNLMVGLPNGRHLILRDYRRQFFEGQEHKINSEAVLSGISLLGPLKFKLDNGRAYNAFIQGKLLDSLKRSHDSLAQRGKEDTPRANALSEITTSKSPVLLNPITADDLDQLFSKSLDKDGKFSNISQGFGLRTPLPRYAFSRGYYSVPGNNIDKLTLNSYVESTFQKVIPTTIGLTKTGTALAEPATPEVKEAQNNLRKDISGAKALTPALIGSLENTYSKEVIADFISSVGSSDLYTAAMAYRTNEQAKLTYEKLTTPIITAVKAVQDYIAKNQSTEGETLDYIFTQSPKITDQGHNEGAYAARDFTRASILYLLFPKTRKEDMLSLVDIARRYYSDLEDFNDDIDTMAQDAGMSPDELHNEAIRLAEVATNMANEKYGLNFTVPELVDLGPAQAVEYIVKTLSTKVRESIKTPEKEDLSAQPLTQVTSYINRVLDLIKNNEQEKIQAALKANSKVRAQIEQIIGEKIDEDRLQSQFESALESINNERSMRLENEFTDNVGDLLTDEEVAQRLRELNPPSLTGYIRETFFGKKNDESYKIVEFNTLVNSLGSRVWALYKAGTISMARHSSGKVGNRVLRHEWFHKVFWNYLTIPEQARALALARSKYGDLSTLDLEEKLAEAFSDFKSKPTT